MATQREINNYITNKVAKASKRASKGMGKLADRDVKRIKLEAKYRRMAEKNKNLKGRGRLSDSDLEPLSSKAYRKIRARVMKGR